MRRVKRGDRDMRKMLEGRNRNGQKVFLPIIPGTVRFGIIGMRKLFRSLTTEQPGHGLLQGQELCAQHQQEEDGYDLAGSQESQK